MELDPFLQLAGNDLQSLVKVAVSVENLVFEVCNLSLHSILKQFDFGSNDVCPLPPVMHTLSHLAADDLKRLMDL